MKQKPEGDNAMTKAKIELRPSYALGAGIALAGIGIALLISGVLPEGISALAAGGITGAFGVASAGRIWPGLPLKLMWQYGLAVMGYGVLIGYLVGV